MRSPYEPPDDPDVRIRTDVTPVDRCVEATVSDIALRFDRQKAAIPTRNRERWGARQSVGADASLGIPVVAWIFCRSAVGTKHWFSIARRPGAPYRVIESVTVSGMDMFTAGTRHRMSAGDDASARGGVRPFV